jgi:hypothetical protein
VRAWRRGASVPQPAGIYRACVDGRAGRAHARPGRIRGRWCGWACEDCRSAGRPALWPLSGAYRSDAPRRKSAGPSLAFSGAISELGATPRKPESEWRFADAARSSTPCEARVGRKPAPGSEPSSGSQEAPEYFGNEINRLGAGSDGTGRLEAVSGAAPTEFCGHGAIRRKMRSAHDLSVAI